MDYWHDSAKRLGIDHPTTAGKLTPDELNYLKDRKGEGPLKQARATHEKTIFQRPIGHQLDPVNTVLAGALRLWRYRYRYR